MTCRDDLLFVVQEELRIADDLGKKKFQKLVYLIEKVGAVPLGYRYKFWFYGPYSSGLDDDLISLRTSDMISFRIENNTHLIGLTGDGRKLCEEHAVPAHEKQAIVDMLERFGRRSAYDLELLTTAHYVSELLGDQKTIDTIKDRVHKVKGAKYDDHKIEAAIKELQLV